VTAVLRAAGGASSPSVIFVLCSARSGSTLLTRLLGTHPAVAAPAETNLAVTYANLLASLETLAADLAAAGFATRQKPLATVRRLAHTTARSYLIQARKTVLCDKSLDNEAHAELLYSLFPDARFICLYRHCMDVVDSVVDASPWGFDAYGAAPYISRWPNSFATGLAEMWLNVTEHQSAFAQAHPDCTIAIRYEDLVRSPRPTMRTLLARLGLTVTDELSAHDDDRALELPKHVPTGPGDHKISFTGTVAESSAGRGRRVPVTSIPPGLRDAISTQLVELGYPSLESWNETAAARVTTGANGHAVMALRAIISSLDSRLPHQPVTVDGVARIAVEDLGCTLQIDFGGRTVQLTEGVDEPLYATSAGSLLAVLLGGSNLGSLLRRGDIRLCQPELARSPEVEAVLSLLAFGDQAPPAAAGAAARAPTERKTAGLVRTGGGWQPASGGAR
jgi:hypothetical protein